MRWGYKRMADLRVSTTDPDASPMHQKNKSSGKLGYLTHHLVDGGKARVILDVLVSPAEVTENLPKQEMLFRSTFRWRLRPRSVTGDAAYGTRENIAAIEKAGIRAYAALPEQGTPAMAMTGKMMAKMNEPSLAPPSCSEANYRIVKMVDESTMNRERCYSSKCVE